MSTDTGRVSAATSAEELFPLLVDAPMDRQTALFSALLRVASARQIIALALHRYHRYGYEGNLHVAASAISRLGKEAWDALSDLVRSGIPECEYFVSVVAEMSDVPASDRAHALAVLARNAATSTRRRVLDALDALDAANAKPVLDLLAEDPELEIRESALT